MQASAPPPEDGRPAAGFELTEHTADVGLRAWGPSIGSVFEQAALAMVSLMYDVDRVEERRRYHVDVEAGDAELLLTAWLNEVLFRLEGRRQVFARFDVRRVAAVRVLPPDPAAPWRLQSTVYGEPIDASRHRIRETVKAATLHDLSLRQTGGGWEGRVLLDV